MSKTSKIQCMACNVVNGTHVEDVKDIKIHVLFSSNPYSSKRTRVGSTGVGGIRKDVFGGGCRGAATSSSICEDTHDTHLNSNPNEPD